MNVLAVQLLVLDVDNALEVSYGELHPSGRPKLVKVPLEDPARLQPLVEHLANHGIAAFGWSTWSSCPEWPRFRVVVPLANPVPAHLWPQAVEWLLDHTGLNAWRDAIDMPVLRDTARLHFLMAKRPGGAAVEVVESTGNVLHVPLDALEAVNVPKPILSSWQEEVLAQRPARDHSWATTFRSTDGIPLDLCKLNGVRLLESLGAVVAEGQPWKLGLKHRTTCPWPGEHTHEVDDDSGILFLDPGRWPEWRCSHSDHLHLGLRDLLEAAGVLK
jgi:hypothetical protein